MNKSTLLISVVIFLSSCKNAAINNTKNPDIVSYNIKLQLDTVTRKIDITSSINIEIPVTPSKINFMFSHFADIKKITINDVAYNDYNRQNDTLSLNINYTENIDLSLTYTLPSDSFIDSGVILLTRPLKWCPFRYNDISEFSATVTVPKNFNVYSSGLTKKDSNNIGNENRFHTFNELNTGLPVIIAENNYYSERIIVLESFKVKFYFHNNDTILTNLIIKECIGTLYFCNKFIGNYNRKQLTFIEIPNAYYCQSMETFLMAGDEYIQRYIHPEFKFWVAHETIHQWLGAGAFAPIKYNNTLTWFMSEGLTEYIRLQYIESKYGQDSLKKIIKESINEYETLLKGTQYDLPISINQPTRVTYLIGPLIYHNIRTEIKSKKWQEFIQQLYADNYGKILSYEIFYATLHKYATDSLMNKMEKWINSKGIPANYYLPDCVNPAFNPE